MIFFFMFFIFITSFTSYYYFLSFFDISFYYHGYTKVFSFILDYSSIQDSNASFNHNFWDLPWPASEKMTSLVILYLEVSWTILLIFLLVSFILLEATIVFCDNNSNIIFSKDEYNVSTYPIHFTPEEEHFIDLFVIFIPTLVVLQLIVPTLGYLYNEEFLYFDTYVSFDVNVIGNQWFWTYEYIIDFCNTEHFTEWNSTYVYVEKEPIFIQFDSIIKTNNPVYRLLEVDNPLILPVNTNVLFSFTSRDVIHSWALPQMGIKVDCLPGRVTHTMFSSFATGIFYGQCSELCGPLHGFMPICVEVISFDHFFIWILIKYKGTLQDLGVYTDLIYTKEVFNLLNLKTEKEINSFINNLKK